MKDNILSIHKLIAIYSPPDEKCGPSNEERNKILTLSEHKDRLNCLQT